MNEHGSYSLLTGKSKTLPKQGDCHKNHFSTRNQHAGEHGNMPQK